MGELQEWKEKKERLGFDKWEILEGLIIRSADFEGFEAEGNIDGKFCIFRVEYDNDFDGVEYHNTIELVKEVDLGPVARK